ncbi:ABC transporter ATP-binding protein [Sneathiella sp.]|jgi:peptide/nickel transport system ATP-binding protein|uniref:ABC transporter ATP-binding protein n=1 Tax=Sneathiella sp. TaxID=1964365 RepID=UPI0039E6CE15
MSGSVLNIRDFSLSLNSRRGPLPILRNLSLQIEPGRIMGLVGESGSGKSMTALAAMGLQPSNTQLSGTIALCGQEIVDRSQKEIKKVCRNTVTMIFQQPMKAMSPYHTIGKQLTDALVAHTGQKPKDVRPRIMAALHDVQLPDPAFVFDKYPHEMSGGQLQRAMIAMAMAVDPKLLIADEPTTALDVTVQAQILRLIRELVDKKGLGVLFITHDLGVVSDICDDVSVMYAGKIVEQGATQDVLSRPKHPYSSALLRAAPKLFDQETLEQIPGRVPALNELPVGCAFAPRCLHATADCNAVDPELKNGVACFNPASQLSGEEIGAAS